jgi:hypothetical protein
MLSVAYGGEIMKRSSVPESHVETTNEGMIISSFGIRDVDHFEFIPQGRTVIQTYYLEILKWLHEAVPRKRPELLPNDWILHHDNALAHKALSIKQFLAQKSITEIEHTPSPPHDFAPNDLWLFSRNKVCLKGTKISGY